MKDTQKSLEKLQAENARLKELLKELIEATEYGVNQWQEAFNPDSETKAQKVIKKAKEAIK